MHPLTQAIAAFTNRCPYDLQQFIPALDSIFPNNLSYDNYKPLPAPVKNFSEGLVACIKNFLENPNINIDRPKEIGMYLCEAQLTQPQLVSLAQTFLLSNPALNGYTKKRLTLAGVFNSNEFNNSLVVLEVFKALSQADPTCDYILDFASHEDINDVFDDLEHCLDININLQGNLTLDLSSLDSADYTLAPLLRMLCRCSGNMLTLDMANNRLGDEAVSALAQLIATTPFRQLELKIYNCVIYADGFNQLLNAAKNNQNLARLKIIGHGNYGFDAVFDSTETDELHDVQDIETLDENGTNRHYKVTQEYINFLSANPRYKFYLDLATNIPNKRAIEMQKEHYELAQAFNKKLRVLPQLEDKNLPEFFQEFKQLASLYPPLWVNFTRWLLHPSVKLNTEEKFKFASVIHEVVRELPLLPDVQQQVSAIIKGTWLWATELNSYLVKENLSIINEPEVFSTKLTEFTNNNEEVFIIFIKYLLKFLDNRNRVAQKNLKTILNNVVNNIVLTPKAYEEIYQLTRNTWLAHAVLPEHCLSLELVIAKGDFIFTARGILDKNYQWKKEEFEKLPLYEQIELERIVDNFEITINGILGMHDDLIYKKGYAILPQSLLDSLSLLESSQPYSANTKAILSVPDIKQYHALLDKIAQCIGGEIKTPGVWHEGSPSEASSSSCLGKRTHAEMKKTDMDLLPTVQPPIKMRKLTYFFTSEANLKPAATPSSSRALQK